MPDQQQTDRTAVPGRDGDARAPGGMPFAQTAQERLEAADRRDVAARARDRAARERDEAAAARGQAIANLEAGDERESRTRVATGAELVLRAAEQRRRAAEHRARAAEHRALGAQDRAAAAADREQSARDRLHALADREALARQLAFAETDALTGARSRAAGLDDLDRELERCRRSGAIMVVAYVDVVGLKALNDSAGHGAGDELLRRAVTAIKARLRPYDLVVRLGGDEFLCAMTNMTRADAQERFREIGAALAGGGPQAAAIRAGFAELTPDDTPQDLIARADRELLDGGE